MVLAKEQEAQLRGLHNLQRGVGEVAMLFAEHPLYKGWYLADIRRQVMPAVLHNQYRVIRNKQDRTIGYISWAKVSEETHKRLMNGRLKLQLGDWASGDIAVAIDVAAPNAEASERILRELKLGLFADEILWIIRTDAGTNEPKLCEYKLSENGQ